jgi:Haemolysin-III related
MVNTFMLQSDGRPSDLTCSYDRTELLADGIVHAIGVVLALLGSILLIIVSRYSTQGLKTASVLIYAAGLLAMLGLSAAYNMWPVSPRKWLLRRFDHYAIYLLIATTYTPFIAQMKAEMTTVVLLLGVWSVAIMGIVLKLALPGAARPIIHRTLSASRLERHDGLRARCGHIAEVNLMADRGRRHAVLGRSCISSLGETSISEGDLALLRADRCPLSLHSGTRLCGLGSDVGPQPTTRYSVLGPR